MTKSSSESMKSTFIPSYRKKTVKNSKGVSSYAVVTLDPNDVVRGSGIPKPVSKSPRETKPLG